MAVLPIPQLGALTCCLLAMLVLTCIRITTELGEKTSLFRKCLLVIGVIGGVEAALQLSPMSMTALDRYYSSNGMPLFQLTDNSTGLVASTFLCLATLLVLSAIVTDVAFRTWRIRCMAELAAYSFVFAPILVCLFIMLITRY
jgi:hypothetical protein